MPDVQFERIGPTAKTWEEMYRQMGEYLSSKLEPAKKSQSAEQKPPIRKKKEKR